MTNWSKVRKQDEELRSRADTASEALARLRWENTLGASPKASFTEYARQCGVSHSSVSNYAHAWAIASTCLQSGNPITIGEALNRSQHSEDRATVIEVMASALKVAPGTVRVYEKPEIRRIEAEAKERAEERGSSLREEAAFLAKAYAAQAVTRTRKGPSTSTSGDPDEFTAEQWAKFDAEVVAAVGTVLRAFAVWERGIYHPSVLSLALLALIKQQDLDTELAALLENEAR